VGYKEARQKVRMVNNMTNHNLFRILRESRQLVAQSGEWGLYKTVFTIEEAIDEESRKYITIPDQALLPTQIQGKYISLDVAQRLSGLSKKQLIYLSSRKKIASKKERGELVILTESLKKYLKS